MFLTTAGSGFRTPERVQMGRHVDTKPRLTVVGSALSLAVGASLLLGGVAQAAATVQSFDTGLMPFSGPLPAEEGQCGIASGDEGFISGTEQVSGQFYRDDQRNRGPWDRLDDRSH